MTKFLNISTDNTLGGSSASNETVSSQKAVKDYVDGSGYLKNTATGTSSLTILGTANSSAYGVNIGTSSSAGQFGTAVGYGAESSSNGVAIGQYAKTSANLAIQIGRGTNSEANSVYMSTSATKNWKLLDYNGKIPDDRLNNPIPSQTGNSGKFLTTNGTNASWGIPKINNLFDFKWSDYELDDQSWVRGDTFSWQDGTVYSDAYNHLLDDYTNKSIAQKYIVSTGWTLFRYSDYDMIGALHPYAWKHESTFYYTDTETPTTSDYAYPVPSLTGLSYAISEVGENAQHSDTIGSYTVLYYLTEDGHKIALPDQEATILNIYNESGVAWYYILDTTNTRFKLPRENPAREELLQVIRGKGNKIALGLNNGDNNAGLVFISGGGFSPRNGSYGLTTDDTPSTTGTWSSTTIVAITQDSTKSGIISDLKDSTSVFKGKKYLYFYVGQFSQTATEQTAGLNAELFNGKVDLNGNNAAFPRVIENYRNGQSWYRVWSDGFCEQGGYVDRSGTTQTVSFYKVYSDANATVCITPYHTTASTDGRPPLINAVSTTGFTLNIYTSYTGAYWMACGYIT